jgi:hypothetical protein
MPRVEAALPPFLRAYLERQASSSTSCARSGKNEHDRSSSSSSSSSSFLPQTQQTQQTQLEEEEARLLLTAPLLHLIVQEYTWLRLDSMEERFRWALFVLASPLEVRVQAVQVWSYPPIPQRARTRAQSQQGRYEWGCFRIGGVFRIHLLRPVVFWVLFDALGLLSPDPPPAMGAGGGAALERTKRISQQRCWGWVQCIYAHMAAHRRPDDARTPTTTRHALYYYQHQGCNRLDEANPWLHCETFASDPSLLLHRRDVTLEWRTFAVSTKKDDDDDDDDNDDDDDAEEEAERRIHAHCEAFLDEKEQRVVVEGAAAPSVQTRPYLHDAVSAGPIERGCAPLRTAHLLFYLGLEEALAMGGLIRPKSVVRDAVTERPLQFEVVVNALERLRQLFPPCFRMSAAEWRYTQGQHGRLEEEEEEEELSLYEAHNWLQLPMLTLRSKSTMQGRVECTVFDLLQWPVVEGQHVLSRWGAHVELLPLFNKRPRPFAVEVDPAARFLIPEMWDDVPPTAAGHLT